MLAVRGKIRTFFAKLLRPINLYMVQHSTRPVLETGRDFATRTLPYPRVEIFFSTLTRFLPYPRVTRWLPAGRPFFTRFLPYPRVTR